MTQSTKERQTAFEANQKRLGLRRIRPWVHPHDIERVKEYCARLNHNRGIDYPPRKDIKK